MCSTSAPVLATYANLRADGLSRAALRAHLDAGMLQRLRRGIYCTPDACADVRAAATHGGTLACTSAARHLGLWVLDEDPKVHVWLRGDRQAYPHEACTCVPHWDRLPAAADAFGLPSVPRILRQVLSCHGIEHFFVVVESALRRRMLTRQGLAWLRANTNSAAREALDFARSDADSGLESLVRWRLRRFGLAVRTQVEIAVVGRVDLVIGGRLLLETDGRKNHEGASLRHKDLVRDANAAAWGYVSLRFDYAMVVHDWDLVERAILGALRTLGAPASA